MEQWSDTVELNLVDEYDYSVLSRLYIISKQDLQDSTSAYKWLLTYQGWATDSYNTTYCTCSYFMLKTKTVLPLRLFLTIKTELWATLFLELNNLTTDQGWRHSLPSFYDISRKEHTLTLNAPCVTFTLQHVSKCLQCIPTLSFMKQAKLQCRRCECDLGLDTQQLTFL